MADHPSAPPLPAPSQSPSVSGVLTSFFPSLSGFFFEAPAQQQRVSFVSKLFHRIEASPHLTRSNLQRLVITIVVLVVSYAILTTPEARRKVLRLLGPPRWLVRRVWRRCRRLYGKITGREASGGAASGYGEEDGYFIEEPPKKKRKKRQGTGSNGDGDDGKRFMGVLLKWPKWGYVPGRRIADGSDDDGVGAQNGAAPSGASADGTATGEGRVHLTRTSADYNRRREEHSLQMTPDRSGPARRTSGRRLMRPEGMPPPIYERDELAQTDHPPSDRSHYHVLHHAYSMASPATRSTTTDAAAETTATTTTTTTTTTASSLCTGLVLPDDGDMEETDHDRFARAWPKIRSSPYGRLVLPPECRFVDPSGWKVKGGDGEDGADGEEIVTMSWWLWFLHVVAGFFRKAAERAKAIATYDYVSGTIRFHLKLMDIIRYRRDRLLGRPFLDGDDDDDDDDEGEEDDELSIGGITSNPSLHSLGGGKNLPQRPSPEKRERFYSVDPRRHQGEDEKKDSADGGPVSPSTLGGTRNLSESEELSILTSTLSNNDADETWATPGKESKPSPTRKDEMERKLLPVPQDDVSKAKGEEKKARDKKKFLLATPGGRDEASSEMRVLTTTAPSTANALKKRDSLEAYRSRSDSSQLDPVHTPKRQPDLSPRPLLQSRSTPVLSNTEGDPSLSPEGSLVIRSHDDSSLEFLPPEPTPTDSSNNDLAFFDTAVSNASLRRLQRDVPLPVPDKNGYIIGDDLLPDSRWTPLLVFVNSRSGPQQGQLILMQLRRLLNPIQIWDLADGDPTTVLQSFVALSRVRILICGGDGTVSWIISTLEKMNLERRWPPIAILPLGTGNDLARIHGWGAGYNNESILMILEQITEAYVSLLDRWELTIENKKGKVKDTKSFMNYLGVGVDAQTALGFHTLRENRPQLFFSRAVNKAWYVVSGAEDAIKASCAGLPEDITLIADGVEIPLPRDSQGIILLNIDSYAGGVPLWSHGERARRIRGRRHSEGEILERRRTSYNDDEDSDNAGDFNTEEFARELDYEEKLAKVTACDSPSSCQDGMLDVVSIKSVFHMGQIKVGLSRAQLICQCSEVTIKLKKKVPVQIDGEPWKQSSCTVRVRRKKDPALMLHRAAAEGGGVETEMARLLDWAEDRQIIDKNVHATLMREFSRRIESKTRQKRVSSNDNLFFSMKRAIGGGTSASPSY